MSEHTPTPWEIVCQTGIYSALGADSGDGLRCAANDGWHIAEIPNTPANVDGLGEVELGQSIKEANARHIVKAVNYHDRLREALRWCVRQEGWAYFDHDGAVSAESLLDELDNLE